MIHGGNRDARDDGGWDRDDDRDRGRAIPRTSPFPYPERNPYPSRYPAPDRHPNSRGGYGYTNLAFENGFEDGYDKGREDARDHDSYDPVRYSRYRSGDHGYDRRYGSKAGYKNVYREGFRAGYDAGYRETNAYDPARSRISVRLSWPF